MKDSEFSVPRPSETLLRFHIRKVRSSPEQKAPGNNARDPFLGPCIPGAQLGLLLLCTLAPGIEKRVLSYSYPVAAIHGEIQGASYRQVALLRRPVFGRGRAV